MDRKIDSLINRKGQMKGKYTKKYFEYFFDKN